MLKANVAPLFLSLRVLLLLCSSRGSVVNGYQVLAKFTEQQRSTFAPSAGSSSSSGSPTSSSGSAHSVGSSASSDSHDAVLPLTAVAVHELLSSDALVKSSCDPVMGANNIAGDVARPGGTNCGSGPDDTCVLFLGNFKSERACASACAANSTATDPCHSWTWHGMSFGMPWQGGCYGRHDMHWHPKMVQRDVVSAVSCKYPAPVPPPPPPYSPGPYPAVKFSWDTVPVFFHSDNVTGPWTEESLRIIAKYPIVTTEKYMGPNGGSEEGPSNSTAVCCEEDRMLTALAAVKAHNKVGTSQFVDRPLQIYNDKNHYNNV
jgi:hypothetical protein